MILITNDETLLTVFSFATINKLITIIRSKPFSWYYETVDVSPMYKKSDDLAKGNYRPGSVLTTLSKLYESAMNDQLLYLLNVLKTGNQHLTKNKYVGVLFTDLSKEFDCLPHGLLLAKLRACGLNTPACNVIASYLSNRKQRVEIVI